MESFRRLYFDTVLFDPRALEFLCEVAGAEKVMLGSDHPFPIGDPEPAKVVEASSLDAAAKKKILGETAVQLFHIDCGCGHGAA